MKKTNAARQALTNVVNRAISNGSPVYENVGPMSEAEKAPLGTMQFCLDVMYGMQRHDPKFGENYLDGLRQAQKDLDHLVSMAAGDPPTATKKSSLLRQLAASTEFNAVSKELIAKAERLERQAEGLRYKFSKMRKEQNVAG